MNVKVSWLKFGYLDATSSQRRFETEKTSQSTADNLATVAQFFSKASCSLVHKPGIGMCTVLINQ